MKFLAKHIILDAAPEFPIYEVADGENLEAATQKLAEKMQTSTVHPVSYDPVRGVILITSNPNGPNSGAVLQNWPEDYEPSTSETPPATP